nr:integrase, catalytic region, zinc finger, CCHC-type, peptidase aspartic, catalytic [Tanacetum cinerariifolium]
MFKINPSQTPRVDLVPNKQSSASVRTNSITNSQRHVIVKENVSSNTVTASSTRLVHTARTRRPQPKGNTRNARVPSASKSSEVKKNITVEDHRRTLLLSKNQKTMSSECNNIKLAIQNDKYEIVCVTCKQCLVTANHDTCFPPSMDALNSHANKLCANVPLSANQKRHRTKVWKPKQVGSKERLACCLNLSVVRRLGLFQAYDREHQASHQLCVEGFGNCLGHNLFSIGQFCDADLEIAFRRNTCFIRDLDGVDLLKGNRSKNLYTINLYDMASASPICLMARATPTKSWLWHQRLSHLNFDTINNLAKNDLVSGLPKFKYDKEHLCPSCEQGKRKRASHPPKPVPNSKQRLHLHHMDLCGPINRTLLEAARTMLIFSHASLCLWAETIATACYTQNHSIIHRHFNKTTYELIQGRKPNISYLYVFGAFCYPKNDREDIESSSSNCIYVLSIFCTGTINSSNTPISSHNVDVPSQQHAQQQRNLTPSPTASAADNVPNAVFEEDLFVNPFGTPSTESVVSSTQDVDPSNIHTFYQSYPHDYQWIKDHPLEQVIEEPSRSVLTRNQLKTDGDMCIYALTVSIMEPKSVKEALTDPDWIDSMQEELHQFIMMYRN